MLSFESLSKNGYQFLTNVNSRHFPRFPPLKSSIDKSQKKHFWRFLRLFISVWCGKVKHGFQPGLSKSRDYHCTDIAHLSVGITARQGFRWQQAGGATFILLSSSTSRVQNSFARESRRSCYFPSNKVTLATTKKAFKKNTCARLTALYDSSSS